jgi:hypothetical protein
MFSGPSCPKLRSMLSYRNQLVGLSLSNASSMPPSATGRGRDRRGALRLLFEVLAHLVAETVPSDLIGLL